MNESEESRRINILQEINRHAYVCYDHHTLQYKIDANTPIEELIQIRAIIQEYHHQQQMKELYLVAGLLGETIGKRVMAPYIEKHPEELPPTLKSSDSGSLGSIFGLELVHSLINPTVQPLMTKPLIDIFLKSKEEFEMNRFYPIRFDLGG